MLSVIGIWNGYSIAIVDLDDSSRDCLSKYALLKHQDKDRKECGPYHQIH